MKTRMVLMPDSHAKPFWYVERNADGNRNKVLLPYEQANRRYTWAAQFVIDEIKSLARDEELVVLIGGDFADMPSLSSWDKGKVPGENQRIDLDIEYTQDAMRRFIQPIQDYLYQVKHTMKKRCPKVRFVYLLGNHENRWKRHRENEPLWDTYDGIPDDIARASELGVEVIPFLVQWEYRRVFFCHYWYKKDPKWAIGGVMPARSLFMHLKESAVSFHTHEWNVHGETTPVGSKRCLYAGHYYEHKEKYPGPQGHSNTWAGLTVLHDVKDGAFLERRYSLEEIKARYYQPEQGAYRWEDMFIEGPGSEL